MSKIIMLDDMLAIAQELKLPNFEQLKSQIEASADQIAIHVAAALGIQSEPSKWEGRDFAGLATTFRPAIQGQDCPQLIHEADIEGDWE